MGRWWIYQNGTKQEKSVRHCELSKLSFGIKVPLFSVQYEMFPLQTSSGVFAGTLGYFLSFYMNLRGEDLESRELKLGFHLSV